MNTGVQYLREHVIQEARIHYAITNTGGFSPNVVQPFAEVLYLIRAPRSNQVKELFRVSGMCGTMYFLEVPVDIDGGTDPYRSAILSYLEKRKS